MKAIHLIFVLAMMIIPLSLALEVDLENVPENYGKVYRLDEWNNFVPTNITYDEYNEVNITFGNNMYLSEPNNNTVCMYSALSAKNLTCWTQAAYETNNQSGFVVNSPTLFFPSNNSGGYVKINNVLGTTKLVVGNSTLTGYYDVTETELPIYPLIVTQTNNSNVGLQNWRWNDATTGIPYEIRLVLQPFSSSSIIGDHGEKVGFDFSSASSFTNFPANDHWLLHADDTLDGGGDSSIYFHRNLASPSTLQFAGMDILFISDSSDSSEDLSISIPTKISARVNFTQTIQTRYSGTGNDYACFYPNGSIFRSDAAC